VTAETTPTATAGGLRRNALGTVHIVFFVVAAAAPLTAVVGNTPAAFMFGNGPGVPATFILVGILYLLFAVGFTAMSRHVVSAGGFYAYISAGLGPVLGVAGAMIALATYTSVAVALYGMFGFFLNDLVRMNGGPAIAWWIYAFALGAVVFVCGARSIEFSGRLLGTCMVAEVTILLLLSAAILATATPARPIVLAPFGAPAVFVPDLGVTLVFIVGAFLGFEATAIFGEEARDPRRTISRATYIAVTLIAVFYAFTSWTISLYYGPAHIHDEAARHTATLYFKAAKALLGRPAEFLMEVLLVVSLFACALSFHNTINRYLFAIARDGLMWRGFGLTHRRHGSPLMAGVAQTMSALGLVAVFALAGSDPYNVVFAWMGTFGSLGVLILQVMVSAAVIAFFQRASRGVGVWRRLVAPGLGGTGLAACLWLMAENLDLVSGSKSRVVQSFPAVLVLIAVAGAGVALWIRVRKPEIYSGLTRTMP
jgi:amino acid transporter